MVVVVLMLYIVDLDGGVVVVVVAVEVAMIGVGKRTLMMMMMTHTYYYYHHHHHHSNTLPPPPPPPPPSSSSLPVLTSEWEHRYGVPGFRDGRLVDEDYDEGRRSSTPLLDPSFVSATCAHCEEQPATYYCPPCGGISFCMECDVVLHRAVKLRMHSRQRIGEIDNSTGSTSTNGNSGAGGGAGSRSSSNGNDMVAVAGPEFEIERGAIRILVRLGEGYFGKL